MKVGVLQVGQVPAEVLVSIMEGLVKTFPDTTAAIIPEVLSVPENAFDKKRSQYNSTVILNTIKVYVANNKAFDRFLAITDRDIFSSGLNYVFGEAYTPGREALISLCRLKPEFYREEPNVPLYLLRALKEAVHELGHTLGVQHCHRSSCVMHFSNSILDTDRKQNLFCDDSYLQAALAITNLGSIP